ncbi:MAG TPA: hypothetical protein VH116_10855 [Gemmatimonadales bacterium]|nr:hypothetical protein [Gemmatimonadales bacterium]
MPARPSAALSVIVTGFVLLAAACGSSTGLPSATFANTVDTVSLFALSDPNVQRPSAYSVAIKSTVRTDLTTAFDFAFDFDAQHRPVLYPPGAVHLGNSAGLQPTTASFPSISLAPTTGYVRDSALVIGVDAVVVVQSRPTACLTGITLPFYGKLHVLAVDTTAHRLDFEVLVDENCGYRGLAPGLPSQ